MIGTFSGRATFGSTTLESENFDIYIAKLDKDGNYEWATKAGGEINDIGQAIAVHNDGSSVISGFTPKRPLLATIASRPQLIHTFNRAFLQQD